MSIKNGNDISKCGSKNNKCRTIGFAVKETKRQNITLILDCEDNVQLLYHISETVYIINDVIIKKEKKSCRNPIISSLNGTYIREMFAFAITGCRSTYRVSVDSVDFININAILISVYNIKITLINSNINITSSEPEKKTDTPAIIRNDKVNMDKCIIDITKVYINATNIDVDVLNINIESEQCLIRVGINDCKMNSAIKISSKNTKQSNVTVKNSTYYNLQIPVLTLYHVEVLLQNISIVNSKIPEKYFIKTEECNVIINSMNLHRNTAKCGLLAKNCHIEIFQFIASLNKLDDAVIKIQESDIANSKNINTTFTKDTKDQKSSLKHLHLFQNSFEFGVYVTEVTTMDISSSIVNNNNISKYAFFIQDCSASINGIKMINNIVTGEFLYSLFMFNNNNGNVERSLILKDTTMISDTVQPKSTEIIQITLAKLDNVHIKNVSVKAPYEGKLTTITYDGQGGQVKLSNYTQKCEQPHLHSNFQSGSTGYGRITHSYGCRICQIGFYNIKYGFLNVTMTNSSSKLSQNLTLSDDKCHPCPVGGDCADPRRIKSIGNFYGHASVTGTISFLPCPNLYCCSESTNRCKSYNTCNKNRTGFLCGKCAPGYHESFLDTKCILLSSCDSVIGFWISFICYNTFLASIFLYLTELITAIKTLLLLLWNKIKSCFSKKKKTKNIVELTVLTAAATATGNYEEDEIDELVDTVEENISISRRISKSNQPQSSGFLSAFISILVSFYQVKSLITIDLNKQHNYYFDKFMDTIFSLESLAAWFTTFCPVYNLTASTKYFIKYFIPTISILLLLCLSLIIFRAIQIIKEFMKPNTNSTKNANTQTLYYHHRVVLACIRGLLFGYKNMASYCLIITNCVTVNSETRVIHVLGNESCYTNYQYAAFAFLLLWAIPYPFTMYLSLKALKEKRCSPAVYLICNMIPPFGIVISYCKKVRTKNVNSASKDILIERLSEMLEQPYRTTKKDKIIFWESFRLWQRLCIAAAVTHWNNPIFRMSFILPLMIILLLTHLQVKPYKKSLKLINWLESTSLATLCFFTFINLTRGYIYVYNMKIDHNLNLLLMILSVLENLLSPFFFLFVSVSIRLLRHLKTSFRLKYGTVEDEEVEKLD